MHRKTIIFWSIAIFSIMSLYMILFSSMQEVAQIKLDAMPEQLLQFVGMEDFSDISNYMSYYGMIFGLLVIAISIFATTFSAKIIAQEEKNKSIEFLNGLAVSRHEIYIAKVMCAYIAILIIVTSAILSVVICGILNGGDTFVLMDVFASAKITGIIPFIFSAISFCVVGIKPYLASGLASGIVLFSYLIGYLGELLADKGELLLYASCFNQLSVKNAIAPSKTTLIVYACYIVLMIICLIIGCLAYQKRDLEI